MKNKWGIGITIFYTLFVAVMVYFVVFSMGVNNDLVREDYYQGDIEFQDKYNKLINAKKLVKDVNIKIEKPANEAVIQFPADIKSISGNISFYKPDDKRLDFKLPIQLDADNKQAVPMNIRKSGFWKIAIDWKGDDISYFKDDEFFY